jgi:hypothetical protein
VTEGLDASYAAVPISMRIPSGWNARSGMFNGRSAAIA